MKKSLLSLFSGVVLAAFVLAGCSSSSDDPTGEIAVANYTGSTITGLYIDPYDQYATEPSGQNKIPNGEYLSYGNTISGELPTGDYMIMFVVGGIGYWLDTGNTHGRISVEEDTPVTVELYSNGWELYSNSRSAEKTVIASGTLKAK